MNPRKKETMGYGLTVTGSQDRNPFDFKAKKSASPTTSPTSQVPTSGPGNLMNSEKMPIEFPINYFPPENSEGIDIRRLINVNPGQTVVIFSLTAQDAQAITFIRYGIFTDALDASLIEFIPKVNGKRILRFHGNPMDNFKLNLSLGPNLAENNMIPCQIYMKPNDVLTWTVINNDVVVNPMGVRMSGYVDLSLKRKTLPVG